MTACDLDSIVSALLWAYYLHSKSQSASLIIPILNIPSKELRLRKDATYLLQEIDKSLIENLFFIDSVEIDKILSYTTSISKEEKKSSSSSSLELQVHLVDHNILSIKLQPIFGKYVTYIIDHHRDEGQYLETCNNNNGNKDRIIDKCASNVSLIINHILSIHKDYDIAGLAKIFGAMINAVILLDTGAFDEKLKKTTDADIKVYKLFEKYNLNKDDKQWYDTLLKWRNDVQGFEFEDLLVKDLEIFMETHKLIYTITH